MDKPSEQALHPQHTKKKGAARDSKGRDDTDIGCRDYDAGGKREQMPSLWSVPSKELTGLPQSRIMTNNYCKDKEGKKDKTDILQEIVDNGPPLLNISKPHRVF